ncbi:hypothetical protein DJ568_08650 [Mucilaginibacter hurinus]|uniref:Tetratricopeptide repeat protein n=1 Tax=Mucilaginibacter hurinus TaxID=2201324 RepID=A0A367GQ85_9SPHI|nr:hypothetical protein [Mucilaginibacter hurinus]RCH55245.1 hypothetical protein DJ568_08650 [Mucilaginibacter hurinus]
MLDVYQAYLDNTMDIYTTIEEKYLRAVDELNYGESPQGLRLLNEIIASDNRYARAHYQLGMIYYYQIKDYQTAGYHYKTCAELEPLFPDVYYHYMHLAVFLNMERLVNHIKAKALTIPGADTSGIYELSGLYLERQKNWESAIAEYRRALIEATDDVKSERIQEAINRAAGKAKQMLACNYQLIA